MPQFRTSEDTRAATNNYGRCFHKTNEFFWIFYQSKYHLAFIWEKADPDLSKKYYQESANNSYIYDKNKSDDNF